jgi:hypothetical protein
MYKKQVYFLTTNSCPRFHVFYFRYLKNEMGNIVSACGRFFNFLLF